jgi:glyoxylase I family protein
MPGNNAILGGGGFHHVAIKVHDFDLTMRMYTEAFGFVPRVQWQAKTDAADKRAAMLDVGDGNYLEIFAGGQVRTPANAAECDAALIHWAFRTTKLDEVIERARAAGFKVTIEPKTVAPAGCAPARIAFCHGPDGEVFEFFEGDFYRPEKG